MLYSVINTKLNNVVYSGTKEGCHNYCIKANKPFTDACFLAKLVDLYIVSHSN